MRRILLRLLGGLMLILISSLLIRMTYPREWLQKAREKVESEAEADEEDFDWRDRIASKEGWQTAGMNFAHDWQMVWKEILIGFTIAGFFVVL